jgi:PAS domain S-box-containing protein
MALPLASTFKKGRLTWSSLRQSVPSAGDLSIKLPRFRLDLATVALVLAAVIAGALPALLFDRLGTDASIAMPGLLGAGIVAAFAALAGRREAIAAAAALLSAFLLLDAPLRTGVLDSQRLELVSVFAVCSLLIVLIDRIKEQSTRDRRALLAAKSAASALSSFEKIAGRSSSPVSGEHAFDAIVRAMVGVHRAHCGAFLSGDKSPSFMASYGISDDLLDDVIDLARIAAEERRPIFIEDLPQSTSSVRSLLATPVIGTDTRFHGVIMIGLYVRHRFTPTEIAKLRAFARQVAGVVETTEALDRRERLLLNAREEQRRLEQVISALPEAVVLLSPDTGLVLAANTAATELFGPIIGADLSPSLSIDDDQEIELEPAIAALRSGTLDGSIELLATRPAGASTPVLVSAAPISESDGTVIAVVASFRDIAALKQAGKLKEEFVSVVSHELRSPLTPIRGFVQLVARELEREGGHDTHVKRLQSISGHVDRITRLVDDLLDVSGLRSGSLDIQPVAADLVEIAHDVVQVRAAATPTHSVELSCDLPAIAGEWDVHRLQQVIDNLIGNAIKYSPAGTAIGIELGIDGGEAVIRVKDSGPGIAEDDRDRVFTAFYRTQSATESRIGGLGLGLYICRELVTAHGGTIDVENGDAGGAIFIVRLPRHATARLAA